MYIISNIWQDVRQPKGKSIQFKVFQFKGYIGWVYHRMMCVGDMKGQKELSFMHRGNAQMCTPYGTKNYSAWEMALDGTLVTMAVC